MQNLINNFLGKSHNLILVQETHCLIPSDLSESHHWVITLKNISDRNHLDLGYAELDNLSQIIQEYFIRREEKPIESQSWGNTFPICSDPQDSDSLTHYLYKNPGGVLLITSSEYSLNITYNIWDI